MDPHQYDFIKTYNVHEEHEQPALWRRLKTFFQEASSNDIWGEKNTLPCALSLGTKRKCNTNTAQEIPGEFVPGSHFAS